MDQGQYELIVKRFASVKTLAEATALAEEVGWVYRTSFDAWPNQPHTYYQDGIGIAQYRELKLHIYEL